MAQVFSPAGKSVVALLLLAIVSLAVFIETTAAHNDDAIAAVVFPPWWSSQQSFTAAAEAGPIAGVGGLPFIIFVPNHPGQQATIRGEWLRIHIPTSLDCLGGQTTS